jgi:hypothetical protein
MKGCTALQLVFADLAHALGVFAPVTAVMA